MAVVAVQTDDKVIELGFFANAQYGSVVVRFQADGGLDAAFGDGGVV